MINLLTSVVVIVISTCPATAPVPIAVPAAVMAPAPEIGSEAWCLAEQAKVRDHFIAHGMKPPAHIHTCKG
ncbi:hypothetical protein [Neorhizobium galegae]|uniref:Secreted protein n=1 Tax=Neorhizobium galegae bv. orientalis str. HAMBI 540 TaxID=1028800 RepID=A0A068SKW8_NEOGA|nr:hypothetical protein [Neorhizobium galegae]CDN46852.1 Hypothetical protein RG540_CH06620 [Neorhizobium galegae bv. orientalis str. HAMBI 540]